ncbi:MAG: DUF1800 domain-containing protein [Planctomycetes bacterium]|nr:DUF1800 domain-containing protein [Planctomycetota bacterium]
MPRPLATVLLALLWLAACGGSGAGGSPLPAPLEPAESSLLPEPGPLDGRQLAHLVGRTQWATDAQSRESTVADGIDAYLDRILDPSRRDADTEAAALGLIAYLDQPTASELVQWWLHIMVNTREPFREVMAFYWHDHFATSVDAFDRYRRHLLRDQIQKLRLLGLGDLRQLLYAMLTDPAMLIWLNGVDNTREVINENLAREFYERFALGVDNGYTQTDVRETARALTGYRLVRDNVNELDRVVFDPGRADTEPKTIFGRTGNFGFAEVVDLVVAERPVAEFVCRQLFEHFCYSPAPAEVVAQLAARLRNANYQLRPVLRVILRSRAFFAAKSLGSHLKSPVETGVGLLRSTGLALSLPITDFLLATQGQRPLAPPNVGGWGDDDEWLATGSLMFRSQLAHALATNRNQQSNRGAPFESLLPPVSARTANAVVRALADRLGLELTPEEIATYEEYLDTAASEEGTELRRQRDPFRGDNAAHVSERARGLLFLLTQHPSYLLR